MSDDMIGVLFWGAVGVIGLISLASLFGGSANYGKSYQSTSPGNHGMFGVMMVLLLVGLFVLVFWNE